ncbi:MAG: hypothetical protein WBN81_03365 [Gammaproteobacteria bacterium]
MLLHIFKQLGIISGSDLSALVVQYPAQINSGDLNSNVQWDEGIDGGITVMWSGSWKKSISTVYMITLWGKNRGRKASTLCLCIASQKSRTILDYVFTSKDLLGDNKNMIDMGCPDKWLEYSDHMPIVFSVAC